MKWLFYALAAINVWYFATHITTMPPAPAAVPAPPQNNNVTRLLMLSELESGEVRERKPRSEPLETASATASKPDSTESVAAEPRAQAETLPEPAGTTGQEGRSADVAPTRGICLSFGPLDETVSIRDLRLWLTERGGIPELRERERRELSRYWVYFPPLPSREAAIERVEAMRASGIEDIFIIPSGDMGNAISLGVYSRKRSLDRRLGQLRRSGYEPSVAPRYKAERATWLDVVFPANFKLDASAFAAAFGQIEIDDINCTAHALAKLPQPAPPRTPDFGADTSPTAESPFRITPAGQDLPPSPAVGVGLPRH